MDFLGEHLKVIVPVVGAILYLASSFYQAKQEQRRVEEELENERRGEEQDPFGGQEPWLEPESQPMLPPPLPRPVRAAAAPSPSPRESDRLRSELERQQALQERLNDLRAAKRKATPDFPPGRRTAKTAAVPSPAPGSGLRATLRDRQAVRRAFVLREILGPPVGLR